MTIIMHQKNLNHNPDKDIMLAIKKWIRLGFVTAAAVLTAVPGARAAELSDAEKAGKRSELDAFYAEAAQRSEPEAPRRARQPLRFTVSGSTRLGYDSNVDLSETDEDADFFYQERISGRLEYDPAGWEFGGRPVTLGTTGSYGYLGYFDRDDMDRQAGLLSPFVRLGLSERLTLETAYDFRMNYYADRSDLNYLANGAHVNLSHLLRPGFSHHVELRYDKLDFNDRKRVEDNLTFDPDALRDDRQYEAEYGFRYRAGRLTLRLDGSWKWNNSNDRYFDYNDYDDFGLDGSVSWRTTERWIATAFGGWHNRDYNNRPTSLDATEIQNDVWYYLGGRIFFALNTWSGVDITATWSQNDSNSSSHEYTDVNTGLGYHLYF